MLCSSEASVLTTLTLTNAEAYHNLVYRLMDLGVPVKAVCVQAVFEGERERHAASMTVTLTLAPAA